MFTSILKGFEDAEESSIFNEKYDIKSLVL